jgi:nitrite reductase/ring-hydroxylating ferredoxin subunit
VARHVVGTVEEIPPGRRLIVEIAGRSIGIFNVAGEFFALRNRCPHQGGPLCEGRTSGFVSSSGPGDYRLSRPGEILRCPWHGWEFDLRTGQSWFDPKRVRVRSYDVVVESGDPPHADPADAGGERARGPYVAETYPVTVKRRRIFVDVPD